MSNDVVDPGCWAWIGERRFDGRPALFLDRDGVVVEEVGYLSRVEDVALEVRAAETIAAFNRIGAAVVLVTNQSGIGRGYFDWAAFAAVQDEIARRLALSEAHLDGVFACGYHDGGIGALAVADHPWRKPGCGMLLAAAERLRVDLTRSIIVGDRAQDLRAGRTAGLFAGVHVATGHGGPAEQAAAKALAQPGFEVRLAPDIVGALDLLDRCDQT